MGSQYEDHNQTPIGLGRDQNYIYICFATNGPQGRYHNSSLCTYFQFYAIHNFVTKLIENSVWYMINVSDFIQCIDIKKKNQCIYILFTKKTALIVHHLSIEHKVSSYLL